MSLSERVIKNVLWNFLGHGVLLAFAFVATPFIIRSLGADMYGVYALTGIVIGYFSFLDLGLGTAVVKYIAEYLAQEDTEKISGVFWSSFLIYFFLGLIGVAAIALSSGFLVNRFFVIPAGLKPAAIAALRISSLAFLASMLLGVSSGILRAAGRFDIFNRIMALLGILQISLTVLLLLMKYSLPEIIVSNVLVQSFGVYLFWRAGVRVLPALRAFSFSPALLAKMFKFGGFVTISSIVGPVLANMEKIFLTAMRPVAYLTYYTVPFSLVDKLSVVRSSFSSVLFPTFSYLHGAEKDHFAKELHERSTLYVLFFYAFAMVFFAVFGRKFLFWWLGEDFSRESSQILIILSFAGLVNALAAPAIVALQGIGKPHLPAFFHFIETVVYIPVSLFFIHKWGAQGAAFAWLFRVLLDACLLQVTVLRIFNEHLWRWYRRLIFKSSGPLIFGVSAFFGLERCGFGFFSFFNLAGLFAIFAGYAFLVWRYGFDQFARKNIFESVKGMLSGRTPA